MEHIITEKKKLVSAFVPYRRRSTGEYEFFLQLRDEHAPIHANMYSLFGGGIEEGETPEVAFLRETEEELRYVPTHGRLFSTCENSYYVFHMFIEEVAADFENIVEVCEGKGGAFMTEKEMRALHNVSAIALLIAEDIDRYLHATA